MIIKRQFLTLPLQEAALHKELHPPESVLLLHAESHLCAGQGQCALLQLRYTALPRPAGLLGKTVLRAKSQYMGETLVPTNLSALKGAASRIIVLLMPEQWEEAAWVQACVYRQDQGSTRRLTGV